MTIGADGDVGTTETKGWHWARRIKGSQWVLMLVMVLWVIEGVVGAGGRSITAAP